MNRDKLIELIRQSGYGYFITHKNTDVEECLANTADHLIANGIGDITAEKHRADVAEEALNIAGEHICNNCDIVCDSKNCFAGRMYLTDYFKQQAEERLKERK